LVLWAASTERFELANVGSDALELALLRAGLHANIDTRHKTSAKQKQINGEKVAGSTSTFSAWSL
jgi:hypothetical protein